jgi:threonine 3-dehydrogenase
LRRDPEGVREPRIRGAAASRDPIPDTMLALRKVRAEPGAELAKVPVPTPGPGEVLIKVEAASICGTDLHFYRWDEWAAHRIKSLPLTFGHEVAGTIVATGPEVRNFKVGRFISAEGHVFCGFCPPCRSGRAHICERLRILGVDFDGGFADYLVLPERNAWEVDPRISPDVASIHDPFGNAVHSMFIDGTAADVVTGAVVVVGCGPIGLFALGIARAVGARLVIGVEPNDFRQDLAKKMGADLVVDPEREDPIEAVFQATDGHGAEVVLEMSGIPRAIDQGTRMLAPGGRMSLLGLPTEPVLLDLTDQVIFKEARLFGVTGRELFRTWQQTTTLLATGMVDVTPVITHRFPLERFEEAFEVMASGRSGKVILLPGTSKR